MSEKTMTLHPDGKQGVNIDSDKYNAIKDAILQALAKGAEVPFTLLPQLVGQRLPDFKGSLMWYVTTVKLDLEARGLIERVPDQSPQVVRLSKE